jgi:hypothetical protein
MGQEALVRSMLRTWARAKITRELPGSWGICNDRNRGIELIDRLRLSEIGKLVRCNA